MHSITTTRDANKSGKFITLEIARFIAAFCVASYHTSGYAAAFGSGWHGFNLPPSSAVTFFFVLSGFVIFTAHASDFGRLERIPRYFWRRISRVYPLYWLSVILPVYLLWPLYSGHYLVQVFTLTPFVHNIIDINPVAWTLRFEVAFYIMFGLILLPYIGRFILAMWIVLDIWRLFSQILPFTSLREQFWVPSILQRHFFNNQEILFFCGLGSAAILLRWRPHRATLWIILTVACLASILLARLDHWGFSYPTNARIPLVGASYAAVIFSLAALGNL